MTNGTGIFFWTFEGNFLIFLKKNQQNVNFQVLLHALFRKKSLKISFQNVFPIFVTFVKVIQLFVIHCFMYNFLSACTFQLLLTTSSITSVIQMCNLILCHLGCGNCTHLIHFYVTDHVSYFKYINSMQYQYQTISV